MWRRRVNEHNRTAAIQLFPDSLKHRIRKIDAAIVTMKDYSVYLQLIICTIDLFQCGVDIRKRQRCKVPKTVGAFLNQTGSIVIDFTSYIVPFLSDPPAVDSRGGKR